MEKLLVPLARVAAVVLFASAMLHALTGRPGSAAVYAIIGVLAAAGAALEDK